MKDPSGQVAFAGAESKIGDQLAQTVQLNEFQGPNAPTPTTIQDKSAQPDLLNPAKTELLPTVADPGYDIAVDQSLELNVANTLTFAYYLSKNELNVHFKVSIQL